MLAAAGYRAVLAGFDWGARTAAIVAALWPDRRRGLVSVSGYLIGSQEAGRLPLPPAAERQWWDQSSFATERGRAGYDHNRRDFAKLIWRTASPKWAFDDATFDGSPAAVRQPRSRPDRDPQLPLAARPGPRRTRRPGAEGAARPRAGDRRTHHHPERRRNGAPHPDPSSYASKCSGPYWHPTLEDGIGHNLPQEAPEAFANAVIEVDPS
jgi:pimeloyl-ACP methyl ester carboxylesterase